MDNAQSASCYNSTTHTHGFLSIDYFILAKYFGHCVMLVESLIPCFELSINF